MNPSELARSIEVVARTAKALSNQGNDLLGEVARYQLDRDRAVSECALARAELAELQQQIDTAEQNTLDEVREENDCLKEQHEEDERELEARDARVAELLGLVYDLAELAHAVHPSAVEHALYIAKQGDVAARLRIVAQVRQASLPFGKVENP